MIKLATAYPNISGYGADRFTCERSSYQRIFIFGSPSLVLSVISLCFRAVSILKFYPLTNLIMKPSFTFESVFAIRPFPLAI